MAHRFVLCHTFSIIVNKPFRLVPLRKRHSRSFSLPRSSLARRPPADPGDWTFSPEWWGTQGHGWGRNEGITVFRKTSQKANGLVTVTAHPASSLGLEDWPELFGVLLERQVTASCEWRVLRFNNETRQSVAKVLRFNNETRQSVAKVLLIQGHDGGGPFLMQIPNCLAFEYLKSMASIGLASVSCAGLNLEHIAKGEKQMRCLCVGLGGGSLPLFLANKMQGCFVEVVEIDNTVISAATEFMGFPGYGFKTSQQSVNGSSSLNASYDYLCLQEGMGTLTLSEVNAMCGSKSSAGSLWGGVQERIAGFEADGAAYVYGLLKGIISPPHYYDLVFIDAFDGKDEVPSCLWSGGGPFLTALRDLLNPIHGTAVVNLHTDMPPPSLLERITGEFGPGFDPLLPGGRRVQEISDNYRNELLLYPSQQNGGVFAKEFSDNPGHVGAAMGVTFTVAVPRQQNICLVVSRGINGTKVSIIDNLKAAACYLERMLKIPFHMSKRISRGFHIVQ